MKPSQASTLFDRGPELQMSRRLITLHSSVQYFKALGCWGMAEYFQYLLIKELGGPK